MKKIGLLIAAALLLAGCTEDNWMDWKGQNEMWLAQNALQDGVVTTESGLQYKIITLGNTTDVRPQDGSLVYCDYEGSLINGYVFDEGTNSSLSMSTVVEGFAEGLKKIYTHGDIILYIPSDLGYAEEGSGTEGSTSFIPPYSTLIFKVHISAVTN